MAVRGRGLLEVEPCRRSPERCCAVTDIATRDRGIEEEARDCRDWDSRARTRTEATAVRAGGRQMRENALIAAGQLERSGAEDDARSSKTTRLTLG